MQFEKATPDSKQSECGRFWIKRIREQGVEMYEAWACGRLLGTFGRCREALAACEKFNVERS